MKSDTSGRARPHFDCLLRTRGRKKSVEHCGEDGLGFAVRNANGLENCLTNLDVVTTEDGAGWVQFFRQMVSRGLSDVDLVISDSHEGLEDGDRRAAPLRGRDEEPTSEKPLTRGPKSAQEWVATAVRSIFAQPDAESTWAQPTKVVEVLSEKFPEASKKLCEAAEDILAFTSFPEEHWRQISSNNPQERLNKTKRSAGHYSYLWAAVISAEAFAAFEEADPEERTKAAGASGTLS